MSGWQERLWRTAKRSGLTQDEIAKRAGISAESLSRIMTGGTRSPRIDTLAVVAHVLGTSVGWLLEEEGYSLSSEELQNFRVIAMRLRSLAAVIEEIVGAQ